MAPPPKSRWADSEEDVALAKRQKEERQRRKAAEQQRRRYEEEQTAIAAASITGADDDGGDGLDGGATRPTKKRRLSPNPSVAAAQPARAPSPPTATRALYRFPSPQWSSAVSVDDYEKLNDIEEGTYGWVARAKKISTGQVVALKRLKLDPQDRNGLPVTGLREIQILKQCDHRNIVDLQEVVVGRDRNSKPDTSIFLVLEFVEHDLKTILEDMVEPFLPSEVKRLLLQLASGLDYLHEKWILHRDLKTSNLLLNNRGQLKIADFGMARYVGDPSPSLTQLVVTLWYRAPELLLGTKTYDQAVDMWSVGCIFAEMMTREPLLQGKNELDQVTKIFELLGFPTEATWPGFRKLPNARTMRFPRTSSSSTPPSSSAIMRAKFSFLTKAGCDLLGDLISLDPRRRPRASEMLEHEYFRQDPKPKREGMFPTFPSKAGQERRIRDEPHAPTRGEAVEIRDMDFSGIFQGREKEERGAGFSLRMV